MGFCILLGSTVSSSLRTEVFSRSVLFACCKSATVLLCMERLTIVVVWSQSHVAGEASRWYLGEIIEFENLARLTAVMGLI
jgi:hypothetical protein